MYICINKETIINQKLPTMTRSNIFKAAHRLAKEYTGDYSACFAEALRTVYALVRDNATVCLHISYGSVSLRNKVKKDGYTWNPSQKVWFKNFTCLTEAAIDLDFYQCKGAKHSLNKISTKSNTMGYTEMVLAGLYEE